MEWKSRRRDVPERLDQAFLTERQRRKKGLTALCFNQEMIGKT